MNTLYVREDINMKKLRKPKDVILKDGRSLQEVLDLHKKWLDGEEDGVKAELEKEDLSYTYLEGLELRGIILYDCDLSHSDLYKSILSDAKLDKIKTNNTLYYKLQCPEESSFIVYKKAKK